MYLGHRTKTLSPSIKIDAIFPMHRSIALSPQMPTFVMAEKRNCTRAPLFRNFVKCVCAKVGPKKFDRPSYTLLGKILSRNLFLSFLYIFVRRRGETGSVREKRGEGLGQWVQCINFEGGGGRTENYPHASNNGPAAAAADARCTGPPRAAPGPRAIPVRSRPAGFKIGPREGGGLKDSPLRPALP